AGAMLGDGWYAPPLGARSVGLLPWTEDALVNYLLDGWDGDHGVAAGPMTAVVDNLAVIDEDDAYAMAAYLLAAGGGGAGPAEDARASARARELSGQTPAAAERDLYRSDPALLEGLEIFAARCANCHRQGSDTTPLAVTAALRADNPANVVAVVRHGVRPPQGAPTKTMPAFPALDDREMRNLLRFMRAHFTDQPPWPDT
ncbi:c-type cytochrome, partial [Rubrimonas sp.]|uniref:c-type cytochrome n=1 Tax=Rubrimonas sp. TaxID=2036015 RepID=UPI002FDE863E